MEEIEISTAEIFGYPVRSSKIPRTYDSFLPKFHSILPKFYFAPPWRIFVFHGAIGNFLERNSDCLEEVEKNRRSLSDEVMSSIPKRNSVCSSAQGGGFAPQLFY